MNSKHFVTIVAALAALVAGPAGLAAEREHLVYSVYTGLNMGTDGEQTQRDFHVNIGAHEGVAKGSRLEVLRRSPTYDLVSQALYRDLTYPIAVLKVIHVEKDAAIARLEKMLPLEETPALLPPIVIVGDLVKLADR